MGRLTLFFIIAIAAGSAHAAPRRVASIGYLCTDELALLLAKPGQLVSVTTFGHDPDETPLAGRARGLHSNPGTLSSVIALTPDLVVSAGLGGQNAMTLAARLGIPVVEIPPPQSVADVRANIRKLAAALGVTARGERLIGWMDAKLGGKVHPTARALMVTAGGLTPSRGSISEELLAYAGIRHAAQPTQRVSQEWLMTHPGVPVIVGRYRNDQFSGAQQLKKLAVLAARGRVHVIDGRLWTCPGPLAAADVERLRREFAR